MTIRLQAKTILITVVVLVAIGFVGIKVFTKKKAVTDQQAVAACRKQVDSTYTNLLDTSTLVAPATTASIQKQEQDALDSCATSNTH